MEIVLKREKVCKCFVHDCPLKHPPQGKNNSFSPQGQRIFDTSLKRSHQS